MNFADQPTSPRKHLPSTIEHLNHRASLASQLLSCYKSSKENPIVKFCVLASGSSGNCALLATDRARILIDAGLSFRELARRLASIGEQPDQIDAVLVTHEHCDHISGLPRIAKKTKAAIYVTHQAARLIDWENAAPRLDRFQAGTRLSVGDIEIDSFTIPHDSIDPVGFCFRMQGIKLGVVTDLGYIPESVKFHLQGSNLLLLESNHDLEILRVGSYPWAVKQRVMSRNGHLSNDAVDDYLSHEFDRSTATLILGHLSEHNNHPEIVRTVAQQALNRRGLTTNLVIASQKQPTAVFTF